MLKLTVYENDIFFSNLELKNDEELVAGRSEKSGLVLSHKRVSREHCRIYFRAGQWIVEDLGSKNGTVVNGEKITEKAISHGDVIKIAFFNIEVYIEELRPSPDEEETVIADDEVFVEDAAVSDERTVKDIRKVSVPPPVEEPPVPSEMPDEEGPVPVHEKTSAIEYPAEEPAPEAPEAEEGRNDRTEILEGPAGAAGRNSIEAIGGKAESEICWFDDHILIGRSTNCDMIIQDETVSREHITISLVDNKYVLTNLNKNNVTCLNGKIVKKAAVKDNDIIKIGESVLKVRIFTPGKEKKKIAWRGIIAAAAVIAAGAALLLMFSGRQGSDVKTAVKEQQEQTEVKKGKGIIETERDRERLRQEAEKSRRTASYLKEGKEFFAKGDFSGALQRFGLVIEIDPENREALDYTGQCRAKIEGERRTREEARTRDKEQRKQKLQEIKKALSDGTAQYYDRGIEYYEKEDYEGAMTMWQKALDINPEHEKAKKSISGLLVVLDHKAEALYHEGLVFEETGNIDKAVEKWKEVIKTIPVKTNEYYQKAAGKLREHGIL